MDKVERTLIVAACPGDEILGCYSVLMDHKAAGDCDVLFALPFQDPTGLHRRCVDRSAQLFNFRPFYKPEEWGDVSSRTYGAVIVPSRRGRYPDRWAVSAQYRSVATHFYTIDEAVPDRARVVRTPRGEKSAAYVSAYFVSVSWPPDKDVFSRDIFEMSDHTRTAVVRFRNGWSAEVPEEYEPTVRKALPQFFDPDADRTPEELFDFLMFLCPSGPVGVTARERRLSSV